MVTTEFAVVGSVFSLFHNGAVEHGKEQILKYQTVILALFGIVEHVLAVVGVEVLDEMVPNVILIEKFLRNKMLLFQEPNEDKTGDEAYATLVIEFLVIIRSVQVVGESDHLYRPSIPVTKLRIELLGEQFVREHLHPMLVKLFKSWIGFVANAFQNVDMSTMGMLAVDVAKQTHLAELFTVAPLLGVFATLTSGQG